MQIWAESGKSALPICNYSQILYQFLTFTQNLKRSQTITPEQGAHKLNISVAELEKKMKEAGYTYPVF